MYNHIIICHQLMVGWWKKFWISLIISWDIIFNNLIWRQSIENGDVLKKKKIEVDIKSWKIFYSLLILII